jgi:hypothetical protein
MKRTVKRSKARSYVSLGPGVPWRPSKADRRCNCALPRSSALGAGRYGWLGWPGVAQGSTPPGPARARRRRWRRPASLARGGGSWGAGSASPRVALPSMALLCSWPEPCPVAGRSPTAAPPRTGRPGRAATPAAGAAPEERGPSVRTRLERTPIGRPVRGRRHGRGPACRVVGYRRGGSPGIGWPWTPAAGRAPSS